MSGRDTSGADRMLARGGRWTASVTVLLTGAGVAPFIVLGRGDQLWDAWVVHNVLFGLLLAVVLWLTAPVEPRNPVVWIIALATAMSGIHVLMVTVTMMAIAWPTSTVPMADATTDTRRLGAVGRVGYLLLLLSVLASLLGLATRARRATGVQRQQIRWVGLGAGLFALAMTVSFVLDPSAELFTVTAVPGGIALVGSFAVAILRYRLFELDRLMSRTVTYAVVSAVLIAVYSAITVVPSAAFDLQSDLLVAAATLVAAAVFVPVRARVQAAVDRRFNRALRRRAGRRAVRVAAPPRRRPRCTRPRPQRHGRDHGAAGARVAMAARQADDPMSDRRRNAFRHGSGTSLWCHGRRGG